MVFFGDHDGTPLDSVDLPPLKSITVDGVSYGDSIGSTMFVDFDEHGKVMRVR